MKKNTLMALSFVLISGNFIFSEASYGEKNKIPVKIIIDSQLGQDPKKAAHKLEITAMQDKNKVRTWNEQVPVVDTHGESVKRTHYTTIDVDKDSGSVTFKYDLSVFPYSFNGSYNTAVPVDATEIKIYTSVDASKNNPVKKAEVTFTTPNHPDKAK